MQTIVRFVLAPVVCAAMASAASAQTPADPAAPGRFETEVVVTAERAETPVNLVPASVVVVGRDALQAMPVVQPAEIISFLPGFNLMQGQFYAGRPVTSARGFFGGGEAEYVRLLVDGRPVGDAESGLIDWSLVPVAGIKRVEAARGPGASFYGDSAVGGVIQIITDRASNQAQVSLSGGSFASLTSDGLFGRKAGGALFTVSGAARRTDGAFAHSEARELVGSGSVEGTTRGTTIRFSATGQSRRRDDPGSLPVTMFRADPAASDAAFRFDNAERSSYLSLVDVKAGSAPWQPLARFYVDGRSEDAVRTIYLVAGLADSKARELSSRTVGGSIEGQHTIATRTQLRAGADLARDRIETAYNAFTRGTVGARLSEVEGSRTRVGVFGSASYDAAARVRLVGAIRFDRVDDDSFVTTGAALPDKTAWSPRGGVTVRLSERGSVVAFGQVARAFKAPTLDQMFDPRPYPDFRGGSFSISNRRLLPQRMTNVEGGLSGGGQVSWSVLAYRMDVESEIDFNVNTFSYANLGESRHTGVEFEAQGTWTTLVQPQVSYALVQVNDRTAGASSLQIKNVPKHLVSVGASFTVPKVLSGSLRVRHTGGGFLDDANTIALEGPTTLDLRVRHQMGRQFIFLDVTNLTDRAYQEYGYTLRDFVGRTVPYVYAGAGRAVRVGTTLTF